MDYFVRASGWTVGYDGRPLIRDIELRLPKGRIMTLIGPNGSGKTTILRSLTRQLESLAGTVSIGGRSIQEMTYREMAGQVSVVLTERLRTERMSCEEIVETGRYPYTGMLGFLSEEDREQVRHAMKMVKVEALAKQDFMRVSDGQRQRVLLARALCQQPQVLVLDEPTSYLDIRYALDLLDILRALVRDSGLTVLMSLHDLDLAQRISDEVICVKGEYIFCSGSAKDIFNRELIHSLYDLREGSYNPLFGSVEMKRPEGEAKVFVIAGDGTGIATYRSLQKKGIPFVTGILHENDVDFQVARELAGGVVSEQSFEPISQEAYGQALEKLKHCDTVINCLQRYGLMNERNRDLLREARDRGMVVEEAATSAER